MPKRMKTERKKHVLKSKIFTILVQVFHPYITILKKHVDIGIVLYLHSIFIF